MTTRIVNVRHERRVPDDPNCVYTGHADAWRCPTTSPWRNVFGSHYPDGTSDAPDSIERYWR